MGRRSGKTTGPGQASAPALVLPRGRLDYRLTTADALAWTCLHREVRGWRKGIYILWFAGAGILLAVLPEAWIGAQGTQRYWLSFAAAFGVQLALMQGFLWLKRRWEAWRLIPRPMPAWFADKGDHLAGTAPDGSTLTLPPDHVGQVIETPTHLFFTTSDSVLIVPATAFRRDGDKHALAMRWVDLVQRLEA